METAKACTAVIGEQFCAPVSTKLVLTCTSSTGTYTATDMEGRILYKVEPREGFHDKRVLIDNLTSKVLVCLKAKGMTMHNTWNVYRGFEPNEDKKLLTLRDSSILQLITGMNVLVAPNQDNKHPNFTVTGKYMAREYSIVAAGGQFLALAKRRFDAAHFFVDSNTYDIDIAPGVDSAFVVAVMVIVDDVHADKNVVAL